jgi:Pyruvate/2-oxoacid:ferredoxin oxidoreductase delta subunit
VLPLRLRQNDDGVAVNELGETGTDGYYAGGDVANYTRTVADALGSGKAGAIGIDRELRSRRGDDVEVDIAALRWAGGALSMTRWRSDDPIQRTSPRNELVAIDQLNLAHFAAVPRNEDRHVCFVDGEDEFGEVNGGITLPEALEEAGRCCNCGVCNGCELCLLLCPDVAIARTADGRFEIDLDHCKGCGICAMECPRGALIMTREGL